MDADGPLIGRRKKHDPVAEAVVALAGRTCAMSLRRAHEPAPQTAQSTCYTDLLATQLESKSTSITLTPCNLASLARDALAPWATAEAGYMASGIGTLQAARC